MEEGDQLAKFDLGSTTEQLTNANSAEACAPGPSHSSSPLSLPLLYGNAVSLLQSPPALSVKIDASSTSSQTNISTLPSQSDHIGAQSLTDLQPVTPSRLNHTLSQICGISTPPRQLHASNLRSPPTPFRLVGPGGLELHPIITKKGNGKISITYPLNMLATSSFKKLDHVQGASVVPTKSPSRAPSDCFSQFLSHPGVFAKRQDTDLSPTILPSRTSDSEVPSDDKSQGLPVESVGDAHTDGENINYEDEQQSVRNITNALNIDYDVYSENVKRLRRPDARIRLPKEVEGLMGEANVCYARGEHENAMKMCMEIIRIAPWCPDPFETLSMIYEEKGENVRSLQYSLLAAHLQAGDFDLWLRLAESCEDTGLLVQAAHCYNKAMKLKPCDYKLHWAAAVLQQQLGNIHRALVLLKSVVKLIPESEVNQRMALARDIARACHANSETALALEVMDEVAIKHPDDVKYEDVNVMCELAITSKQFRKVFDMLVKHCHIEVQYESVEGSEAEFVPTRVKIPDELPIDLKCKCVLAAIPLGCFEITEAVFEEICQLDSSEYGDLQFDIAELLMEEGYYSKAIYALDILVKSKDYSLAAVWLKKGECHRELQQHLDEMNCFKEVIASAPGHAKAYLVLCQVLRKLEKYKEAVEVIQDAETYELEDEEQMLLNYETFKVYFEWSIVSKKRHEKLCKAGDLALLMLANKLESAFVPAKTVLLRKERNGNVNYKGDIRASRRVGNNYFKYRNTKTLTAKGSASVISNNEWWSFFLTTCDIMLQTERYVDGITIIDAALAYGQWYNKPERRIKMERIACSLCIVSGNFSLAYTYMRPWLLSGSPAPNILWNLFNQITVRSQDQRHHRFCLRSLVKEPDSIALAVLTGHNSLATGTYKHSLGEYVRVLKKIPTEPLFMLLIGVIYTHVSSQRFTTHKNSLVTQAIAFLNKYTKTRKCSQEVYYNIGRAYQQFGLLHFAVFWYKKALSTPTPEVNGIDAQTVDLQREIAYNLAILYKNSGNITLAVELLSEHCVV